VRALRDSTSGPATAFTSWEVAPTARLLQIRLPQDGTESESIRAIPVRLFPPIAPGATIQTISIIFDEGTGSEPDFTGFAFLDNIDVNGVLIGKPGG